MTTLDISLRTPIKYGDISSLIGKTVLGIEHFAKGDDNDCTLMGMVLGNPGEKVVIREKYFKDLSIFLEDYGFQKSPLPWRCMSDRYTINQVEDGDENQDINPTIYTINITADDECVYRGKLLNSTHAAYIFGMVAERRLLTGKDDFPPLPIEPVKFVVYRTNDYDYNNPIKTALPGTEFEYYEQERGKNSSNPYMETLNRCVKKFTTAQELIDYNRTLAVPLILEGETLEIYNDYRE